MSGSLATNWVGKPRRNEQVASLCSPAYSGLGRSVHPVDLLQKGGLPPCLPGYLAESTLPQFWSLPGVIHYAHLADYRHLDLPWILEFVLNLAGNVARQAERLLVAHLIAFYHDSKFASRLKRVTLGNSLKRVGQILQFFQPFHVSLQNLATRPGACCRQGVGGLNKLGFPCSEFDIEMMRFHGMNHSIRFPALASGLDAQLNVRPFHFAVDRFADVVK